ncbi:MAG: hypothetical protein WBC18_19345 [Ottowia sp.]|uniref:hypothetical protein n=1 Tax=Ottowia sp. TaxID=1898956 RepID=UPI003C78190C
MKPSLFSRLAWAVSVALTLAACGGGDSDSQPQPNPNSPKPAITPVGLAQGAPVNIALTSAGGTLSSADGKLTITVPEGALTAATTLTIQPIANNAPGRIGAGYRLLPEGVAFAKPVQLSFVYDDAGLSGSHAQALGIAFQQSDGTWRWQDGALNEVTRTVTANTTHFSDWSLVKGLQLRPPSATVKVGGSVPLRIAYCYAPSFSNDDLLAPLAFDCESDNAPAPLNTPVTWSVNGARGGNAAAGTVTGNEVTAQYTAPKQKPEANPVAVSAEVQGAKGKLLLVSNITIADDFTGYQGSISGTMTEENTEITYQAGTLEFIPFEDLPGDLKKYVARGSLTIKTRYGSGRIETEVLSLSGEQGVLVVYDPVRSGTPLAGRYWFSLYGLLNSCPEEVIAGGGTLPSYGADSAKLEGARGITCTAGGSSVSFNTQWSLRASEPAP